ncbi:MAG: squalene synthase HpnC [Fimbriimonadaceae bacterium]|nr:squalene synthase HpnC [Fimbriimonadaceae bacterium]
MAQSVVQRYDLARTTPASPVAARQFCAQLTRQHYENFTVVSWFLPGPLRQHFANVYAYCRVSDDLADEVSAPDEALRLLAAWREGLHAMYAGQATHPVFVALQETVDAFEIPQQPFDDLLDAFVQDRHQSRYQTWEQVLDYCTRSANPVGRLVLYLGGYRDPERQGLSDCTCTALQLANFWQDVRRDWVERERVYLPQEDLDQYGVSLDQIAAGRCTPQYRELLRWECARTYELFRAGLPLLETLDRRLRRDVTLFSAGGWSILDRIARQDYDTLSRRPALGKVGKVALMLRVLTGGRMPWQAS